MILDGGAASSPPSQPHVNDRCGSTQTFRPGCTGPTVLSLSEIGLSVHAMGTSHMNHPTMKESAPSCWRDVVRETWTHSAGGSSSKQLKRVAAPTTPFPPCLQAIMGLVGTDECGTQDAMAAG